MLPSREQVSVSEKRRSIHKVFPKTTGSINSSSGVSTSPISNSNIYYQHAQSAPLPPPPPPPLLKIQVFARLVASSNNSLSINGERPRSLVQIPPNSLHLSGFDEESPTEAFQKREKIANSPDRAAAPSKSSSTSSKQDAAHLTIVSTASNSFIHSNPSQTVQFDEIFDERVSDSTLISSVILSKIINASREGNNLFILNLNRSVITSSFLEVFMERLRDQSRLQRLRAAVQCLDLSLEKATTILEQTHIKLNVTSEEQTNDRTSEEPRVICGRIAQRLFKAASTTVTITGYIFSLFDVDQPADSAISEIILLDIPDIVVLPNNQADRLPASILNKAQSLISMLCSSTPSNSSNHSFLAPTDAMQQIIAEKCRIADKILVLSNFIADARFSSVNSRLLTFSEELLALERSYHTSGFFKLSLLQEKNLFNRTVSGGSESNNNYIAMRQAKKSVMMLREQVRVLIGEISKKEQENVQVMRTNSNLQGKLHAVELSLEASKKQLEKQNENLNRMSRQLGLLDNFDRSYLQAQTSKQQDEEKITKHASTQTMTVPRESPDSIDEQTFEQATPQCQFYLEQLDDMLNNLESKRSMSQQFSPRNLSLANLAVLENQAYRQKLTLREDELRRLSEDHLRVSEQLRFAEKRSAMVSNICDQVVRGFEERLLRGRQMVDCLVEFYEGEIDDTREMMKMLCLGLAEEATGLAREIEQAKNEKINWVHLFTKKTEEIYKHLNEKIEHKNLRIKQYEEVLQKFGSLNLLKNS